jgi:NADH-quinone oxidoreductase subunit E
MSVRRLADEQPTSFEFTPENRAWAEKELAKYPPGRQASAVLALLWRAQKQSGYWLPRPAIETVAAMLDMPNIRVLEVATFYTMFNLAPVGRHYVQLCGTTPCMLCGAEDLKAVCRKRIGEPGHVSSDGLFSWTEVECLGACCNAPMVQINEDYYEDLTPENFGKLLEDLAAGRPVRKGSQIGRESSEPVGGLTSLTTLYGADGHRGPASQNPPPPANDQPHLDKAAARAGKRKDGGGAEGQHDAKAGQ